MRRASGHPGLMLQMMVMLSAGFTWWSSQAFLFEDKDLKLESGSDRMRRSLYMNGSIRPLDPKYVIGRDNVTLVCSYDETNSSSDLYFEKVINKTHTDTISRTYLTILSPTEVKLEMPAVSVDQSGYYYCVLNQTALVAGNDVRVGFEPKPVENFECVSENLESMTCSWCPAEKNHSVIWELHWRVGSITGNCSQQDNCSCYLCGQIPERSHPLYTHCLNRKPQFFRTTTYNFTVVAKNTFGRAESIFLVDPVKIVKPGLVNIRNAAPIGSPNLKESKLNISWDAPSVSHFLPLLYNVTYKCEWDHNSTVVTVESMATKHYVVLENLYPHTEYEVAITSKPLKNGFWSEPAVDTFVSPETVPLESPTLIDYRRTECRITTDCFKLIVYWQPTLEKYLGSRLEGYELSWKASDGQFKNRTLSYHLWSYHIKDVVFEKKKSYIVELRSVTSKGLSPPARLSIPALEKEINPPKVEGVRLEENLDNKKYINFTIISDHPCTSLLGLFYCRTPRQSRSIQTCEDDVHEVPFDKEDSEFYKLIPDPGSDYMFAASVYSDCDSSGLQPSWLCIWDQCGDIREPKLALSTKRSIENALVLELTPQDCFHKTGKVHFVELQIKGPGYDNLSTLEPFRELVIDNLRQNTTYKVSVRAFGDPQCNISMKSGLVEKSFSTPESASGISLGWIIGIIVFIVLVVLIFAVCGCKIYRQKRKRERLLEQGCNKPRDTLSDATSEMNFRLKHWMNGQPIGSEVDPTGQYEDVPEEHWNGLQVNSDSELSPYGRVAEPDKIPNGILHFDEGKPGVTSVEQPTILTDADMTRDANSTSDLAASVPLLNKTADANLADLADSNPQKVIGGYNDYSILQPVDSDREKLVSDSSDMTSPSSTEESIEYTHFDSPVDSKVPVVALPKNSKVPVVALPEGFQNRKSENSESATSDTSSTGSVTVPCVHKPVQNGIGLRAKSNSEGSDVSSHASEYMYDKFVSTPTVPLPSGQFMPSQDVCIS